MVVEKQVYPYGNGETFTSVVLDQFCCTVVKRGNLLLLMRNSCIVWSVV